MGVPADGGNHVDRCAPAAFPFGMPGAAAAGALVCRSLCSPSPPHINHLHRRRHGPLLSHRHKRNKHNLTLPTVATNVRARQATPPPLPPQPLSRRSPPPALPDHTTTVVEPLPTSTPTKADTTPTLTCVPPVAADADARQRRHQRCPPQHNQPGERAGHGTQRDGLAGVDGRMEERGGERRGAEVGRLRRILQS